METTKIIFSGLTGRTGQAAMQQVANVPGVAIVGGISRRDYHNGGLSISRVSADADGLTEESRCDFKNVAWYMYAELGNRLKEFCECNVLVDFSDTSVFDEVVSFAFRKEVPLVSGTSNLTDKQLATLYDATNRIPVFRGGNFRFKVKKFLDDCVALAQREEGNLALYEDFYRGKSLPSETSKVLERRIMDATGKMVEVHSSDTFDRSSMICDWEFHLAHKMSTSTIHQKKLYCRTIGFNELGEDVLRIAKVMANKPLKPGAFYDLDEIWDDLVSQAP